MTSARANPFRRPVTTARTHFVAGTVNVCHTYYSLWPGMGNVSNMI